jgi:hypothetical protein
MNTGKLKRHRVGADIPSCIHACILRHMHTCSLPQEGSSEIAWGTS